MTTSIREFLETIRELTQKDSTMRVRERNNQNAETISIPRVRACGTTETQIMPLIREDEAIPGDNRANYQHEAMSVVWDYLRTIYKAGELTAFDVYVVWFCKTLQNWKALVSTSVVDGLYFEVTYNGDKKETYLDIYQKVENICIDRAPFK